MTKRCVPVVWTTTTTTLGAELHVWIGVTHNSVGRFHETRAYAGPGRDRWVRASVIVLRPPTPFGESDLRGRRTLRCGGGGNMRGGHSKEGLSRSILNPATSLERPATPKKKKKK